MLSVFLSWHFCVKMIDRLLCYLMIFQVQRSYMEIICGLNCNMAISLFANTVLIATSSAWLAAVIMRVQQLHVVKLIYQHYWRWLNSPSSWIYSAHLLNIFWFTHCSCSLSIWDTSNRMFSLRSSAMYAFVQWTLIFYILAQEDVIWSNVRRMRWP
jgi:hypothetical protein